MSFALCMMLAAFVVFPATPARADMPMGLRLPPRAKRLDDGRYEVRDTPYAKAVAHFTNTLKQGRVEYALSERVHRANVKYSHFRSLTSSTAWEHVNVAEYDGSVFVTILARDGTGR